MSILLLDTSTPECRLWVYDADVAIHRDVWQADRSLAEGILSYIEAQLKIVSKDWSDISALGVFKGPGSFTGLRIGITVLNAIAADRHIPIVGEMGEQWKETALLRIQSGQDDKIVLPEYGRDARITTPRK